MRDSIYYKRRNDLEVQGLEEACVETRVKSKTLLVGGFYRPPNNRQPILNLLAKT